MGERFEADQVHNDSEKEASIFIQLRDEMLREMIMENLQDGNNFSLSNFKELFGKTEQRRQEEMDEILKIDRIKEPNLSKSDLEEIIKKLPESAANKFKETKVLWGSVMRKFEKIIQELERVKENLEKENGYKQIVPDNEVRLADYSSKEKLLELFKLEGSNELVES